MKIVIRKMKCPEINPATAGIIVVIFCLFCYFCGENLAIFIGLKSIDVHEAESTEARNKLNRIKQRNHRHHPPSHHSSMPHDQPSDKSQNSLHAVHGLSTDSYLIQKLQSNENDKHFNKI